MADNPFLGLPDVTLAADGTPAKVTVRPDNPFASLPDAPNKATTAMDAAGHGVTRGATFNFKDELEGLAAAGGLDPKDPDIVHAVTALAKGGYGKIVGDPAAEKAFADQVAKSRALSAQEDAEHPVASTAGQIAGAVGSTLAAAPAAAALGTVRAVAPVYTALSKLPATVRAILGGAAGGAGFGAGNAEGDLEDRAKGAGIGAAVGGAAGGVIAGVVAPTASAIATGIRARLSPTRQAAADIGRAMERDATTPAELMADTAAAQETRPGVATIADAGGENVKGLVERIANSPGEGRSQIVPALTERQQQQASRLTMDLASLTGTRRSALEATNATMAERATAAAPLYRTALAEGDNAIFTPELERLTSSPTVKSAMAGAVRVWRDNAIADGYGAMNPGAMVDRGGILNMNGGNLPAFPNLQFWDYTKRILDDKVRAAIQAGQNQKARTLTELTSQLRTELDNAVPSYRAAREAWGGPSQYLDAIQDGARMTSKQVGADEVRAMVADMTPAQREAYTTGALSGIFRTMGNDSAKLGDMTKYLRSPEMRQKIEAIMPTPEAAAEWAKRLDFEVKSSELTGRALGNSATARRLAEQEDAAGLAIDLVASTMHGVPPVQTMVRLLGMVPEKIKDTVKKNSDAIVARVLTDPRAANPEDLARVLEMSRGYMTGPRSSASLVAPANAATETVTNK